MDTTRTARPPVTARRWAAALTAVVAIVTLASGCSSFGKDGHADGAAATTVAVPAVTSVSARDAADLQRGHAGDPNFVTLDVRTPSEFAAGHLAGATNVDFYDPAFGTTVAALDKTRTYLVYCHSGNRSGQATQMMQSLGFQHVYDVQGGTTALAQAGVPLVR